MSIYLNVVCADYLDVVCADRQLELLEGREQTVRAIGEILPLVMARYGIDNVDRHQQAERDHPSTPVGRSGHSTRDNS